MDKIINEGKNPVRSYPKFYEKVIPIAIGFIVIVLLVLMLITIGVALGIWTNPV